jgi:hypothetical protein
MHFSLSRRQPRKALSYPKAPLVRGSGRGAALGDNRPANPKINDAWVTDAGVAEYYNGTDWVPYLSPVDMGDSDFVQGLLEAEKTDLRRKELGEPSEDI